MVPLLLIINLLWIQRVIGYSETPIQYTIQTDVGPDRYFRYQTFDGQYRKEKRLDDGTVFGTYGWVDATGLLRLTDYVADKAGYRIVRTRKIQMEPPNPYQHPNSIKSSSKFTKPVKKVIRKRLRKKILPITSNKKFSLPAAKIPEIVTKRKLIQDQNLVTSHRRFKPVVSIPKSVDSTPSQSDKIDTRIAEPQNHDQNNAAILSIPKESNSLDKSSLDTIPVVRHPVVEASKTEIHTSTGESAIQNRPINTISVPKPQDIDNDISSDARPPKKKLKFRPLFVRRKSSGLKSRRRSNYTKARQQVSSRGRLRNSHLGSGSNRQRLKGNSILNDRVTDVSKSIFKRESHSQKSIPKSILPAPRTQPVNELEGRVTIDFDLGNQYRKERILPDGTTVGEHGYVDPLGILRVTTYRSGPNGMQETKRSHWVGTRQPYT